MKHYKVKGSGSVDTYLQIMREREDGFEVIITSVCENYSKTIRDFIDRPLFDACLRTGYLTTVAPVETAPAMAT